MAPGAEDAESGFVRQVVDLHDKYQEVRLQGGKNVFPHDIANANTDAATRLSATRLVPHFLSEFRGCVIFRSGGVRGFRVVGVLESWRSALPAPETLQLGMAHVLEAQSCSSSASSSPPPAADS